MTAYAFGTGELKGDNGSVATLFDVSLNFDQKLETIMRQNRADVALGDGELKITGKAMKIVMHKGEHPTSGQIYFKTQTSNFRVAKEVVIKLNNVLVTGNQFEARPDDAGNVFTLSMSDEPARDKS